MGLALAWLLALQDADALIRALADDAVEKRDAAHAELVRLGATALPKIESALASSTDPEVLARLKQIKEEIRRDEQLRAVLGPTTRVTLKVDAAPLGEALERLNAQGAGDKATCDPALQERVVKLDVADLSYFEALQALAAQNEGIYLEVGDKLRLRAGASVPAATACAGPFVIQAAELRTTRPVNGGPWEDLSVHLVVRAQQNIRPLGTWVFLEGFPADYGGEAIDWSQVPKKEAWSRVSRFESKGLLPPDRTQIDLKGLVNFYFAVDRVPYELELPAVAGTKAERKLQDDRFALHLWHDGKEGVARVELKFSYPVGDESENYWRLYSPCFSPDQIEALDREGKPVEVTKVGSGTSSGGSLTMRHQGKRLEMAFHGGGISRVRVMLPKTIHTEVVPFEMAGVPIR